MSESHEQAVSGERRAKFALWALICIAPAPSVGVLVGLTFEQSGWGVILWMLSKVWLFGLPVLWHVVVDRQRLSLSPPQRGGWAMGIGLGAAMAAGIVGAYALLGRHWIDAARVREVVEPLGLTHAAVFIGGALYWILINSVLEEYVYRWFVYSRLERVSSRTWAVIGSAALFVVHHTLAMANYFDWRVTILASIGIGVGGAAWSWLYMRYRSIWIAYVSHAMVDVAVFAVAWLLIFG